MDPATIIGILLAFGALFGMIKLEGVHVEGLLLPAPMLLVFGATIAVGIAGLGALIPSAAGIGGGNPQEFVDGLHNAFFVGAGLAAAAAVASFVLIRKNNVHHEVVELPVGQEPLAQAA